MLRSLVSTTTSAWARIGSSIRRSWVMDPITPSAASGWRRLVPSKRRTRTSSDASRNSILTRFPVERSASRAGSTSSRYSVPPRPTTSATFSVSDPGTLTSSATLVIRAGGMLSITNQPRSSKVAAAVDRPAPESPVMIR